jgi:hypothetical protein
MTWELIDTLAAVFLPDQFARPGEKISLKSFYGLEAKPDRCRLLSLTTKSMLQK